LILAVDQRTLRSILSTAALEGSNIAVFRKSTFIFKDAAPDTDQQLLASEDQWIFTIGKKYYLPPNRRHFPLSFRLVKAARRMEWHVTRSTDSIHFGILTSPGYNRSGHPRPVIGLDPSLVSRDVPARENPVMVRTFLNLFIKANGNYTATNFRTLCWDHSTKKQW